MGLETVSTAQAAELLNVSEELIRDRIARDQLVGVTMEGGAWRIPVSSLRVSRSTSPDASSLDTEPPPYIQRLNERLDSFDAGTIPCAEAAQIVERHVRLHLAPHLKGIKLGEMRPSHVSALIERLNSTGRIRRAGAAIGVGGGPISRYPSTGRTRNDAGGNMAIVSVWIRSPMDRG